MSSKAEIDRTRRIALRERGGQRTEAIDGAPFVLRLGALAFDYVIIVLIPVIFLLAGRLAGHDGSELLKSEWNNLGWLLGVMAIAGDFLILPALTGQTAGKMLTGIRVVGTDGAEVSLKKILLRQILGGMFTLISLGGLLLIAVFHPRGRTLHDILAGTIVVSKERQIRF